MSKQYKLVCYSKLTETQDRGIVFTCDNKAYLEAWARQANKQYPDLVHEVVEINKVE